MWFILGKVAEFNVIKGFKLLSFVAWLLTSACSCTLGPAARSKCGGGGGSSAASPLITVVS